MDRKLRNQTEIRQKINRNKIENGLTLENEYKIDRNQIVTQQNMERKLDGKIMDRNYIENRQNDIKNRKNGIENR